MVEGEPRGEPTFVLESTRWRSRPQFESCFLGVECRAGSPDPAGLLGVAGYGLRSEGLAKECDPALQRTGQFLNLLGE